MKKKLLENEFCPESLDKMKTIEKGKFCEKCKTDLEDLTNKSFENLAKKYLGSNKCVILNTDQIDFLKFYRTLGKVALASSLFIGTPFVQSAKSQSLEKHYVSTDSCLVTGRMMNNNKMPVIGRTVYAQIGQVTYETKTDSSGTFVLVLPKNQTVDKSNIPSLDKKKIKGRNRINLRKTKIKLAIHKSIGWL